MSLNNEQYAAIKWLRYSIPGRVLQADLKDRIAELREQYETQDASETTRLLLQKYKQAYHLLFDASLEDLADG